MTGRGKRCCARPSARDTKRNGPRQSSRTLFVWRVASNWEKQQSTFQARRRPPGYAGRRGTYPAGSGTHTHAAQRKSSGLLRNPRPVQGAGVHEKGLVSNRRRSDPNGAPGPPRNDLPDALTFAGEIERARGASESFECFTNAVQRASRVRVSIRRGRGANVSENAGRCRCCA